MLWDLAAMAIISTVKGGGTPRRDHSEYWGDDIPWVTPTDLPSPGTGIANVETSNERITSMGLNSSSATLLPVGTVLYSSRATIGKIGIAQVPVTTNQGFTNFIPNEGVDSKFLAYALQYNTSAISALAGSTTFKEVSRGSLKKFKVPLPPFSEQCRIVEILDQADRLRKQRAEADAKAASILTVLFYNMVGDPATNPKVWPTAPLNTLVKIGTKLVDPNDTPYSHLPHIGGEHIEKVSGQILPHQLVNESNLKSSKFYFTKNHILYSKIRPYLNKVAFPQFEGVCSADIYPLQPISNKISPWFLIALLRSNAFLSFAKVHSERLRMPKLNKEQLGSYKVPIPSPTLVSSFDERAVEISNLLSYARDAKQRIESLFDTIIYRAFSGDLTAKWREAHMKELLQEMEAQTNILGKQ